jgi:CubicO group peptidase (beta-lactamase class C family)
MVALAVFGLFFHPSQIPPRTAPESFSEHLDSFINEYLDWFNIPGLSIAVVRDRQVVFSKGYGVSDVNTGKRVTPATLFSTASVTKLFVGTAIMQLAEQTRIDLTP